MHDALPHDTRGLIEGYLGRPVQDELEAAVVLEAWSGVPAESAIALGRAAVTAPASVPVVPDERPPTVVLDRTAVASDVAFIVAVLFVGFWLSRRTDRFAVLDIDRAWRLALPVSLAAQWFLRRRVFTGGDGLGRLRRERWLLVPAGVLLVGLVVGPSRLPEADLVAGVSFLPWAGVLAAALATLWIAGFVVSRRGWGVPYGVALVAVLVIGGSKDAAVPVLALVVAATLAAAAVAVLGAAPSDRLPGALGRAVPSALIGGGMGLFLVSEPRFVWAASGLLSAFTIVPSLLGSLVGGLWMTRLWRSLPASLRSVRVGERRSFGMAGPAVRLFGQAVALVLLVAASCSAIVVWRARHPGNAAALTTTKTLLVAHAALGLAGLCVALLETLGRWGRALVATALGVAAALSLSLVTTHEPHAGMRILVGAVVALVVSLPGVLALLHRPDHRIAAVT